MGRGVTVAQFDLGEDLTVVQVVPAGLVRTFGLSRQVLEGYEGLGYAVVFEDEQPHAAMRAAISDTKGTRLTASVALDRVDGMSRVTLNLRGTVIVGGMQAVFATPAMVRKVAKQKVQELLHRTFHGIEPDPEPEPVAKSEPVAEPGPEPEPEPVASHSVPASPQTPSPSSFPQGSLEQRLAMIKTLFERGLIDEDDYRTKKADVLSSL
jgi:hypothetical protein